MRRTTQTAKAAQQSDQSQVSVRVEAWRGRSARVTLGEPPTREKTVLPPSSGSGSGGTDRRPESRRWLGVSALGVDIKPRIRSAANINHAVRKEFSLPLLEGQTAIHVEIE